ncbi:serine/arginine-rich splicing factor SC35 isoform X2 [Lathyrus oleraceus]|uniref:serine/arginine-rich splicing factor SC35 isoform X2 n=1 Tax=Pisum sativum TaxID=3888 RepID=UPI0021D1974B|nr:serine/arginine-rich splicing factor SC35-like isoform X2 [Pisum sativum]
METSILGLASFPCYTTPNRSLPKLRILSMRHQYPLASKIVVKNLPYFTRENTLQTEFSNFGKIAEGRSKGFAFIQYTSQDDAMLALENMDQKNFHGRTISVNLVKLDPYELCEPPPRATGPPKKCNLPKPRASGSPKKCNLPEPRKWNLPKEYVEDVDCWY